MSGEVKGKTFPLDREVITLGRAQDNAIVLTNPAVSGHHCSVARAGEQFMLRDLESTNGTRLNSKEVTEARLHPKDLVQVGSVEFMFDTDVREAVDTHSYAETEVEVSAGPVSAPDSFTSISPFGARRREGSKGLWALVITVIGLLALGGVIYFFFKLVTTR